MVFFAWFALVPIIGVRGSNYFSGFSSLRPLCSFAAHGLHFRFQSLWSRGLVVRGPDVHKSPRNAQESSLIEANPAKKNSKSTLCYAATIHQTTKTMNSIHRLARRRGLLRAAKRPEPVNRAARISTEGNQGNEELKIRPASFVIVGFCEMKWSVTLRLWYRTPASAFCFSQAEVRPFPISPCSLASGQIRVKPTIETHASPATTFHPPPSSAQLR